MKRVSVDSPITCTRDLILCPDTALFSTPVNGVLAVKVESGGW